MATAGAAGVLNLASFGFSAVFCFSFFAYGCLPRVRTCQVGAVAAWKWRLQRKGPAVWPC